MADSMEELYNLLGRGGWRYHKQDQRTVLIGFQGKFSEFVVGLRMNDDWLTLSVPNYLPPIPEQRRSGVFRQLLWLNSQIAFVRFAIEPDDKVTLMADLPCQKGLSFDLLTMALEALSFYADDTYPLLYKCAFGQEPGRQGVSPRD